MHTWTAKKTKKRSRFEGDAYLFKIDGSSLSQSGLSLPKGSTDALERSKWYEEFGYGNGAHNRLSVQMDVPKRKRTNLLKLLKRKG